MTGFHVDPEALTEHASVIEHTQPFTALNEETALLPIPSDSGRTAIALGRLRHRLHDHLGALAAGASSLGRATSHAADEYRSIDRSITNMARD